MNLSELSIRRPVFAWMLMAGLIVFGAIAFMRMGVSQLPDADFPIISVAVTLEGAAPEVMETDVIDVIEDSVMTLQGVRTVTSSARQGSATVSVEFDLEKNIDVALQEVQNKITQVQRQLPKELDPPVIAKTNPEDQPIMWLSLRSDKHPVKDIMFYVKDKLKNQFATVEGVGDIFLGGYVDPSLRIWVSREKLRRYALSVQDVMATIRNEHSEMPAGRIETEKKEYNLRTLGEAASIEEFGKLLISSRGGQPNYTPVPLNAVASVEEGLGEVRRISRSMGEFAVGIGIRKQRGSNAVDVSRQVKKKIAEVQKELPEGMKVSVVFDATRFIEEAVNELNFSLFLSAILTSLVCWLFLGSWSSTVNVILAIPTSIIGTFIILYFSGFTLNTFTLLGLTLAIGIVVDDAIMVLENIVRHREHGESRFNAAIVGSKEITFAAIVASIAIIAIFLPVAFMKGAIGKFFYQFGVTMTAAVLLSLVEALTLTPMRASKFIDPAVRTTRIGKAMDWALDEGRKRYRQVLAVVLEHRWKVILASLCCFFYSLGMVRFINKEFMPAQDQSRFLVRLMTPVGSSLSFTNAKFKEAEKFLMSRPEVDRYFAAVGGFGGGEVNAGVIFVTLKPRKERAVTQQQFMDITRAAFSSIPEVKAFIQDLSMRGFTASRGFPVEFAIRGPSWDQLGELEGKMKEELNKTGLVTDLDSDYQVGMPEVQILPDRNRAAQRGVSMVAVGETINAMMGGVLVGKYPKNGHRYDTRLRLVAEERLDKSDLQHLFVRNNRGELVPLSELVSVRERPTLQVIARKDRERAITIFANVKAGASQAKALEAIPVIAKKILPDGYRVVLSGSSQGFQEAFGGLLFAFLLGIVVSYMVLASQFNSFVDPIVVLLALPFSISGAFLGLLVANQSINIYSLIGFILLMGIVKKNSILLVDFTNKVLERDQCGVKEALLEACPIRLRPILMTSIATVAGALPPAFAVGPGAETRIPMAVAVIGGVILSTLLTLLVVPCAYSLFRNRYIAPKKVAA